MNNYEEDKGLVYLEQLSNLDPDNPEVMIEISQVCVDLSLFKKAYNWSNKAIETGKLLGKAFAQRGAVLVATADYNIGDEMNFCDKLVFDLAYVDYGTSYEKGNLIAKSKQSELVEYDLVSSKGDWFLNANGRKKISPSDKECEKLKKADCYSWIKREVKSKD